MKTIFPYITILRPVNLIFSALCVIITAFLTNSLFHTTKIFYAIIVVVSFAGGANILNDILDINIDNKNRPQRPIPSGKISTWSAIVYMLILYIIGIYIAFYLPWIARLIAVIIVLPILILYTSLFKSIPLFGNMVIALALGMVFLFSEAVFTQEIRIMWTPAWLAFGLSFIRELIKDIADLEGDQLYHVYTFPVKFGIKKSLRLTYLLIIFFCILWWIPYFNKLYGNLYAITLIFAVEIPLILSIFFLRKNPTSSGCAIVSRATKWITFGGMITILCSSF